MDVGLMDVGLIDVGLIDVLLTWYNYRFVCEVSICVELYAMPIVK